MARKLLLVMVMALVPGVQRAQDQQQNPPSQQSTADKPQPEPREKPAARPQDAGPPASQPPPNANYDPFHAAQDMEVGTFYMHKGDLDAAIERFKDAIRLKPRFAKPRLLLGEIYEKKGDTQQAVRYYKEFLEIMPAGSPDAKKVQKRIDKLAAK